MNITCIVLMIGRFAIDKLVVWKITTTIFYRGFTTFQVLWREDSSHIFI